MSSQAAAFGRRAKREREQRVVGVREMGKRMEIDPKSVMLLEGGQQEWRHDHMRRYAGALDLDVVIEFRPVTRSEHRAGTILRHGRAAVKCRPGSGGST